MPASETSPTVAYPAGLGRRFGALLYDALLIIAVWMATLFPWVIFNNGEGVTEARRRKADLLDARAAGERSFVAHNLLKSAAAIERGSLND